MRAASRFGVSQSVVKHPPPHPGATWTPSGWQGNLVASRALRSLPQLPAAFDLQDEKSCEGHATAQLATKSSSDPPVLQVDWSPPGTASWPSPPPLEDPPREPIDAFPRPATAKHAEIMSLLGPKYSVLPRGRGRELAESWTISKHSLASSRGFQPRRNRVDDHIEEEVSEPRRPAKQDWLITNPSRSFWRPKIRQDELDGQSAGRSISTPDLRSALLGSPLRQREGPSDRFALGHHVGQHPAMRPSAVTASRWNG